MKKKILILVTISLFFLASVFCEIALAKGGGKAKGVTSVKITPSKTKVKTGKTMKLKAHIKGKRSFDKSLSWYVNDVLGGNDSVGTITQTNPASFTPPSTPPNPSTVRIKAVSAANPTKYGTSKVKIELLENVSAKDPDENEQPEVKGAITAQDTVNQTIEVNSLTISVTDLTKIKMKNINGKDVVGSFADLTTGKFVEIKTKLDGSTLVATKIEIKNESQGEGEDEFEGTIDQKNDATSTIVVKNSLIYVTEQTKIKLNKTKGSFSDLAIGQKVEVKAVLSDLKLVAVKIEVKDEGDEDNNENHDGGKDEHEDD